MFFPFGETVTLIRRSVSGQDGDGNDVHSDVRVAVPNCAFHPAGGAGSDGSDESVQGRDTVTASPTLYLPAGTQVQAVDAVEARGITYEVDGAAADFRSPFTGWAPGIVIRLKAVTG